MSQQIRATDLRVVAHDARYAVDRFDYGNSADERDPRATLSQAEADRLLDAALSSLQIGSPPPGGVLKRLRSRFLRALSLASGDDSDKAALPAFHQASI